MVNIFKRRKIFDDDADWVPQKGRAFKMKTKMQKEDVPREEQPREEQPKEEPFRMTAEPPDMKYDRAPFRMKVGQPNTKYERTPKGWTVEAVKKPDNIKTDAEGMDRAYAQGDVYGEGNKEYAAGSHTFTDWFDDFRKIPQ